MAADFKSQLDQILRELTDETILRETGKFVVQLLKDRVRGEGKGVKAAGSPTSKLKPLSKDYIKQRARDRRLHPDTAPARSNLTRHGDMLNALRFEVKQGELVVTIKDKDQLLKAIYTNETRPWVNISKGEETQITSFITKLVAEKLRSL